MRLGAGVECFFGLELLTPLGVSCYDRGVLIVFSAS